MFYLRIMMDSLLRKYSQVFWSTGLGKEAPMVYATRRKAMLDRLTSLCIMAGTLRAPGSDQIWTQMGNRQVQDPALLYLTGINQPGIILVLDPLAKKTADQVVLFLPAKDSKKEFWEGVQLGLPPAESSEFQSSFLELQRLTGVTQLLPAASFKKWLAQRLPLLRTGHVYSFWLEFETPTGVQRFDSDHHWEFRKTLRRLFSREGNTIELRNVAPLHLGLRSVLDSYQIKMARTAQAYTRQAFLEILPHIPKHKSERTLSAELEYRMLQHTDEGLAFPTIVASGPGACVLHYQKKDESLNPGDLVLLDFGCRVGSLCSDISRTVPVTGRFNPLQRLLYQIVLDAQRFHQKSVKPGALLRDLNKATWTFLEEQLRDRFFALGGTAERAYPFNPHGVSHLIGEQVHEGDPFRLYQDQPLRPGQMLSNEPGLYGYFSLNIDGVLYQGPIGIRIEDDLLVTEKGCVNLSASIPKSIDEIEKCMDAP